MRIVMLVFETLKMQNLDVAKQCLHNCVRLVNTFDFYGSPQFNCLMWNFIL